MKQKILRTIKEHELLTEDMHIVLGLSGGPDSMCLFDALFELADEKKWTLYAVHVNHKFRPGDAEKDQKYVEAFCKEKGVECFSVVCDCNELAESLGKTSEEAGRIARYDAFSKCALELTAAGISKEKIAIAVAHNADDQCETLLFRIMRGTGVDGLAGIPYKRATEDGFMIVRPLLDVKRIDIEKYCRERNLKPCIDKTNLDNLYTRNKIRNLLVPYIEEKFNENIVDTVNRLAKSAAYDKDYLWQETHKAYNHALSTECEEEVKLFINNLIILHRALRFRVYAKALHLVGMDENLSYAQLEALDGLLEADSPSAACDLADGFKAFREYEKIVFSAGKKKKSTDYWTLRSMSREEYDEYKKRGTLHGAFSCLDCSKLEVRSRRDGDKIKIGNGNKKLQDFLVDEKVPKHYRDDIKVLTLGSEILWILPSPHFEKETLRKKGRFSADYKIDNDDNENIIVLEYKTKM